MKTRRRMPLFCSFRKLEHVPEKHALELDPMGGNRFSEKDMRQQGNQEHFPIPLNREML